jgi:hypothetical protein
MRASFVTFLFTTVSFLQACTWMPAYKQEVFLANENEITINAGHYVNPGPMASKHCQKYGKSAVFYAKDKGLWLFKCQ